MNPIEAVKKWIEEFGAIEPAVYEPHPEKDGYLKLVRMRSQLEIWHHIRAALASHERDLSIEYVSSYRWDDRLDAAIPEQHRFLVYLTPGSNEGYFIHVDVAGKDSRTNLGLVKCLGNWNDALLILNFLTVLAGEAKY